MKLKVYGDRMSQPTRAVIIFCKANGIDFQEIKIDIAKRQHLTPEYTEINPMKQVPAIVDGRFKLFESHAILRYLACAFPGVAHHWYPADLFTRARINSVLDWHHSNLRRGTTTLIFNAVLAPVFGHPLNPQAAAEAEKILTSSLSKIESIWLKGNGKFLLGNSQPSIADLSLVCEIMQLEVLEEKQVDRLLGPHKKILQWIEDTRKATSPHFDEAHKILFKAKARYNKKQSSGDNYGTESGIRAMLPSKMSLEQLTHGLGCCNKFSGKEITWASTAYSKPLFILFFFLCSFSLSRHSLWCWHTALCNVSFIRSQLELA
ncbi:hypothetical protein NE237_013952 [Protea cynaroides]|uniref:Glutathione S-transferase T1 n=1 Tax=Protea cynaroides TaxID=273540 RepID=A0A9Q0JYF3_9MAGN|nr:hypothetical protein NE237_013952 [Protea cynaroides]